MGKTRKLKPGNVRRSNSSVIRIEDVVKEQLDHISELLNIPVSDVIKLLLRYHGSDAQSFGEEYERYKSGNFGAENERNIEKKNTANLREKILELLRG